jgi:hypothetical protein
VISTVDGVVGTASARVGKWKRIDEEILLAFAGAVLQVGIPRVCFLGSLPYEPALH